MSIFQDIAARNNAAVARTDYAKDISSIKYRGYDASKEWEFKAKEYEDARNSIKQLYASSEDPDSEADKTFVGNLLHSLYPSISAEYARENASDIIYRATGRKPETDNILELFGQTFNASMANLSAGMRLANFYMFHDPDSENPEYFEQQKEALMKDLKAYKTDYNRESYENYGSMISKVVAETGNLLPTALPSIAAGTIGSIIGGPAASGGILAALAGNMSGRALLGAGITSASSSYFSAMQEIGSIALEMEEYGFDSDIIRPAALIGGTIAGAFEPLSDSAMGKMMEPINRYISQFGRKQASLAFKQTLKSLGKSYLKSTAGSLIKEPATEILQTIPEMMAVDFATNLMKDRYPDYNLFEGYSYDDYIEAFKETYIATVQGTIGMSFLQAGTGLAFNSGNLISNHKAGKFTTSEGANSFARVKDIKFKNDVKASKDFNASNVAPIEVVRVGDKFIPINLSQTQKEVLANNSNGFVYTSEKSMKAKGNDKINLSYGMSLKTINQSIEDAINHDRIQGFTYYDAKGRDTTASSEIRSVGITLDGQEIINVMVSDKNESSISDFENDVYGQTFTKVTEKDNTSQQTANQSSVFDNIDSLENDNNSDNNAGEVLTEDEKEAEAQNTQAEAEESEEQKKTAKQAEEAMRNAGIDINAVPADTTANTQTATLEPAQADIKTDAQKLEERKQRIRNTRENERRFLSAVDSIDSNADLDQATEAVNTFRSVFEESAKSSSSGSLSPKSSSDIQESARVSALVATAFAKAQGKSIKEFMDSFTIESQKANSNVIQGWIEKNNIYISQNTTPLTISHELAHHFLNMLDQNSDLYKQIESTYGKTTLKGGVQEAFAQGLERYIEGTMSANKAVNTIFENLKKLCKALLNIRKSNNVSDVENKAFFDSLFASDEQISEELKQKEAEALAKDSNKKIAEAVEAVKNRDNNVSKGDNTNGSETAIREGLSDRGRDGISSNNEWEVSNREMHNGERVPEGVSEAVRLSEGADSGQDRRRTPSVLIEEQLKKEKSNAELVKFKQLESNEANATKFKKAIDNARETQPFGLYVDSYDINTSKDENGYESIGYSDSRIKLFMSDDESIGFAIKEDGDIVSVFADKTKGNHPLSVYSILLSAIENGGNRLDCYGKRLLKFYMRMGFVPQGKVLYNEEYESAEWKARKSILGSPDVYALYWGDSSTDETAQKLAERFSTITDESVSEISDNLPVYEDIIITEKDGKKLSEPETEYGYDRLMQARDEAYDKLIANRNEEIVSNTSPQKTADAKTEPAKVTSEPKTQEVKQEAIPAYETKTVAVKEKLTPQNTKETAKKIVKAVAEKKPVKTIAQQEQEQKIAKVEEKAKDIDSKEISKKKKESKTGNLMDIDANRTMQSYEINLRNNDFNKYMVREIDGNFKGIDFIQNGFLKPTINLDKTLAVVSELVYNGAKISNRDLDIFRTSGGGLAVRVNAVIDENGNIIRSSSDLDSPWLYIPKNPIGNYMDMTTAKAISASDDTNTVRGTAIAMTLEKNRNSLVARMQEKTAVSALDKATEKLASRIEKTESSESTIKANESTQDTIDYVFEPSEVDFSKIKGSKVERTTFSKDDAVSLKNELNANRDSIYGFDFGDDYSYEFAQASFSRFNSRAVSDSLNALAGTDAFTRDNVSVYGDDLGNIIVKSNVELKTADTDNAETIASETKTPKYVFIPVTQIEGMGEISDIIGLYYDNDLEYGNMFVDDDLNLDAETPYKYDSRIIAEGYLSNITNASNAEQNGVLYSLAEDSVQWRQSADKVREITEKYSSMVKEGAEYWKDVPANRFFPEYRKEIIEMLKEYPKVEYDGIKMLANSGDKDLPLKKELLQSKLYNMIQSEDIILLPRFSHHLLNEAFGVDLKTGSFAEGLSVLVDGDKFVEFKICNGDNLARRMNESDKSNTDLSFIVARFEGNDSIYRINDSRFQTTVKKGYKAIIFDIDRKKLYEIKKEDSRFEILPVARKRIPDFGQEILSAIREYTLDIPNVKKNEALDYEAYRGLEIISENPDIAERSAEEAEITKKEEKPIFYSIAEESGSEDEIQKASNLVADIIIGSMTDRQLLEAITNEEKGKQIYEYLSAFSDEQKDKIAEITFKKAFFVANSYSAVGKRLAKMLTNEHEKAKARNELIAITKKALKNAKSATDLKNNVCKTIIGEGASDVQKMFRTFVDSCIDDSTASTNDEAIRQIIQFAVNKDGSLKFTTQDKNHNPSNLLTKLLNFDFTTSETHVSSAETAVYPQYYDISNALLKGTDNDKMDSSFISISELASQFLMRAGDNSKFLKTVYEGAITGNLTKGIADGLTAKIRSNTNAIDSNNKTIIQLSNEIDAIKKSKDVLAEGSNEKSKKIAELSNKNKTLEEKNQYFREKNKAKTEKIEELKNKIVDLAKRNRELQEEIDAIKASGDYTEAQRLKKEYDRIFLKMKNNSASRDSRAIKVLQPAINVLDKGAVGEEVDMRAFGAPRWDGYFDDLQKFAKAISDAGLIKKDQDGKWILQKNLGDCTLTELGAIIDAENAFFKATDKRMAERRKQYKQSMLTDKQAIINDIARFYQIQNDNGEFARAIRDYVSANDPNSASYKDENKSKILKTTELEIMSNILKRECPALYSYFLGGYMDFEETDEGGTRVVRKYVEDNINTATDKERANVMRRKSAFVKKISSLFGVKEGNVNNASARLFSNDRQQAGTISIADFNAQHDFSLVVETEDGFFVGDNVPDAFKPIAEYMAYKYNHNAEMLETIKQSVDKLKLSDEEKKARFATLKAQNGILTKAELDASFSRDGIQSGYSMSQLMGIYIYSKQEDGLRDMLTGQNDPLNTNNLTVGNVLSVIDKFMYDDSFSNYRELADYMLTDMGSRYDEIADVYYILNNKVLTRIPNYFMIRDELGFYDYDMSLTGQQYNKAKVNDKSTKERTGRHSLNLDVMSLFTQAIDEQEHYIAFAKLADRYDKMFFSNSNDKENDVSSAYITAATQAGHKRPQETLDTLHKWWDVIKQPGAYSGDSMPLLGKVRSNMAISVLWGNISTVLQQFPTYVLTLSKVGFKDFFSTLGKVMAHPNTWADFVYDKSPQMRDRARLDTDVYRQQMADPNSLLSKAFGEKGARISEAYKDFITLGLKPMEAVDKWVANASWLAAYEWNLKNLERVAGMTDEQFDMACSQNATQFVMDTNSSKNAKDNALLYSNRDNALKSMLLFTSQLNKQFNMMYGSFMDWKMNKDLGADINSLLRNMAVIGLAAFGAALTSGAVVPDDDDDDLEGWLLNMTKQTMLEYVGMVPFAGDTLKSIMRGYSFADSNIAETTINASKVIGRKISGDSKLKDSTYYNALAKEIAQIAELVGLPSTQPMKLYRAIRDENALDMLSTNWGKAVR